jgi:Zn finger protein HypA/HybF involved in hydrogenase expression
MHEYHLVKSLLDSILEKVSSIKDLKKVTYIKLKIGNLKMINKDNFSEMFKKISSSTLCEEAKLDIEEVEGDIFLVEKIEGEFGRT